MDTVDRASQLADNLVGYEEKQTPSSPNQLTPPNSVSPSPYSVYSIPATMTQPPDSQRQFYKQGGAGQYRFFNNIPIAANQTSAPSQNQAQQYARWQASNLTLNQIADSPQYSKVPIEQFDANGNLIVVNFQGPWNSTTTYNDGQEVSYGGNVWVATSTNTNSAPAIGNPFWELVGPQSLDSVADGVAYGRVLQGALTSGSIDFSKASFLNKNLDNVGDGSTYARLLSKLIFSGSNRSPHASTIAQLAPTHWYPSEGLSGNSYPVQDIGSNPINLTLTSLGGSTGISSYSLVNGDSLLGAFLSNYAAYYFNPSGYGGSFTFSTWAYWNGGIPNPGYGSLMSMSTNAPTGTPTLTEEGLFVDIDGTVKYIGQFTGGSITITTPALNWTVPHHIVLVVNGSGGTIVVDGHIIASGSTTGSHDSFDYVVFGANWNGTGWQGNSTTTMQHMTMWDNVAFSLGQIQALYQAGASGAQSLDNLIDGFTWQKVGGVTGNKTNTSSYNSGSISINVQTINAAGTSVTAGPLDPQQTVETITMPASATGAVLISLSTNNQASSGLATGITFHIYNGSTLLYETGVSTKDSAGNSLGNVFVGVSGLLDTTVTGGTVYTVKASLNSSSSSIACTNILFSVLNIKS